MFNIDPKNKIQFLRFFKRSKKTKDKFKKINSLTSKYHSIYLRYIKLELKMC